MSTIALAPLMCYSHPNGEQSLLKYPNIICGSAEHGGMLAVGLLLLVLGVFGFLALCTFAAIRVPTLECERATPSSALLPLPGLPFPLGLLVVRSTSALPRAFDFLAYRAIHRLPGSSVHLGDHDSVRLLRHSGSSLAMEGSQSGVSSRHDMPLIIVRSCGEVPMLNALDSWMSFCILLLVAGTALYVEPVSKGWASKTLYVDLPLLRQFSGVHQHVLHDDHGRLA